MINPKFTNQKTRFIHSNGRCKDEIVYDAIDLGCMDDGNGFHIGIVEVYTNRGFFIRAYEYGYSTQFCSYRLVDDSYINQNRQEIMEKINDRFEKESERLQREQAKL